MSHVPVSRFVRNVLLADAGLSAPSGAVMLFGGAALQSLLGLPGSLLLPAGLLLLGYAVVLAWLSRRERLPRFALWGLIGFNLLWAAECAAIALGHGDAPTVLGQVFLAMHVAAGLGFSALQFICLRRPQQHAMA